MPSHQSWNVDIGEAHMMGAQSIARRAILGTRSRMSHREQERCPTSHRHGKSEGVCRIIRGVVVKRYDHWLPWCLKSCLKLADFHACNKPIVL